MKRGKERSIATRLKMSKALMGRKGPMEGKKHSEETKRKISESHMGKKIPPETRLKMSLSTRGVNHPNYGKQHSEETRRRISEGQIGKVMSLETRLKMSEAQKGEKNHQWRGGLTKANVLLRGSIEYRLWRKSVLERDGHACVWCGSKTQLQTDHIKPFAFFPELRLAIDNGRTLCLPCHKTTDTYLRGGGRKSKAS